MAEIVKNLTINLEVLLNNKPVAIEDARRALGATDPCEICKDIQDLIYCAYPDGSQVNVRYCPNCGRRLRGGADD